MQFSLENLLSIVVPIILAVVYLETRMTKIATKSKTELDVVSLGISEKFGKIELEIAVKIADVKTAISDVSHKVSDVGMVMANHITQSDLRHTDNSETLKMQSLAIQGLESAAPTRPRRVANK